MSITPINLTRVTHNLQTMSLLESLRQTTVDIFKRQTQLATGRAFNAGSDDPIGASQALKLNDSISRQEQILENVRHGDLMLSAADSALTEVSDLLIEAESLASRSVGLLGNEDERTANAELVQAIRDQLIVVGNREVNGSFLFAGRDTQRAPFVAALGGVAYLGDTKEVLARVARYEEDTIGLPGHLLFGALSAPRPAAVDLTPALTENTRLEDLAGANAAGIRKGTILLEGGQETSVAVDLSAADTIGDVMDMIAGAAEEAGLSATVQIDGAGLSVTGVTVTDPANGSTASDLGLVADESEGGIAGVIDLGPRLTPNTPIEALQRGEGVGLEGGLTLVNGTRSVVVDLSQATTVQDILNKINNAGVYALARIDQTGRGIEVLSRLSGTRLTVAESEGTLATDLGIRTVDLSTPLSSLNFGRGVEIALGEPDLRITAKDGNTFDVNLDGAETVGDVIEKINEAAGENGVGVTASLDDTTNGIRLDDATGGEGPLAVGRAHLTSYAVDDLGLLRTTEADPEATVLIGADVGAVRADGVFTALIDLEDALRAGDEKGLSDAAERLTTQAGEVVRMRGVIGARSASMRDRLEQTETAVTATRSFLSEIEDLDYTEAVTRFQQAQTALQASLLSGSQILNVSLLNYLS